MGSKKSNSIYMKYFYWFLPMVSVMALAACNTKDEQGKYELGHLYTQGPSLKMAQGEDISNFRVDCPSNKDTQVCILVCHRPPGNPSNSKELILPLSAVNPHLNHGNSLERDTLGACHSDDTDDSDTDDNTANDEQDSDTPSENDSEEEGDDTESNNDDEGNSNNDEAEDNEQEQEEDNSNNNDDENNDDSGNNNDGSDSDAWCALEGYYYPPGSETCWCLENQDIDVNCDGLDDDSGVPIY